MDGPINLAQLTVLLAEDDPTVSAVVRTMLRRMMISAVVTAANGEEALHLLQAGASGVDLIISDWNMPVMSGLELFARSRTMRPAIPFLMMTGRNDQDSIIAAKANGVSSYIVKPFAAEELRSRILLTLRPRPRRPAPGPGMRPAL
jgi:two-component system chemotaxis response regulator CheY